VDSGAHERGGQVRARLLAAAAAAAAVAGAALVALPALPTPAPAEAQPAGKPIAYSIELNADIDPATQRWIHKALGEARDKGARIAIIRLDTPGGLDDSMRAIIKDVIGAPMPVVAFVYPNGGRAASAGLYITESADVAAMAPQTNIGSATPIGPGTQDRVLGRKIRNDAAAYVRALAGGHGRNPELAEQMVRRAKNVEASRALRAHLVDVVVGSEGELLRRLDGFRVRGPKARTLRTAGVAVERRDMPLQYDLLEVLVNPTVAYLLMLAGLAGIAFEIFSPGIAAPGVLGAIALVLGLFGTAQLPVNLAGLALLLIAAVLFVLELKFGGHAIFAVAGVAALIAAGLLLYDTGGGGFGISAPVVIFAGALIGALTLFAVSKALEARRGPVSTGWEEMVGAVGTVRAPFDPLGQVFVHGALWRARLATSGAPPPRAGDRVRVEAVDGLTLEVSAAGEAASAELEQEQEEEERGKATWRS
jgi:membrane-bound serine protease (ClpP class)